MTQSMGSIASAPPTARGDFGSGSSSPQASLPPPQQSPSAGSGNEHSSQSDSQQTDPSQPPATAPGTQQAARAALDTSIPEGMILDVSGVRYADSAGLGELTIVYSLCMRKQCPLVLAAVPLQLRQMLELTRLDALLPSAVDLDGAKQEAKARLKKLRSPDARADAATGE